MKKVFMVIVMLAVLSAGAFAGGGQGGRSDQVTISVWSGYPEMEAYFRNAGDAYTRQNPNVRIETLTNPLREFEQRLGASIPSDTAGDIIETSYGVMAPFIEAGFIPPIPANSRAFATVPGRYPSTFLNLVTVGQNLYGIPSKAGLKALFWNTEMFREAGLTRAPQTFDEMAEYAKRLAVYDNNGNLVRSGHSLRLTGQGSGIAEKWEFVLYPMGGDILIESRTQPGKFHAGYNNDAGRRALKFYIDAVYVDKWDSFEVRHDTEAFQLGFTAMYFRESNVVGDTAQRVPGLPYDTALIPSDVRSGSMAISDFFFVTRSCRNPEIAHDFLLFMSNDENCRWLFQNVGWPPVRRDVDYSSVYAIHPQMHAFGSRPVDHVEYENSKNCPAWVEIQSRLADRLAEAYLDSSLANNPAGIARAIAAMADETNAILRREGLYAE